MCAAAVVAIAVVAVSIESIRATPAHLSSNGNRVKRIGVIVNKSALNGGRVRDVSFCECFCETGDNADLIAGHGR